MQKKIALNIYDFRFGIGDLGLGIWDFLKLKK
jgi:hypothetical protein